MRKRIVAVAFLAGMTVAALGIGTWQGFSFRAKALAFDDLTRRLNENPADTLFRLGGKPMIDKVLSGIAASDVPAKGGKYDALFDVDAFLAK